MTGRWGDGHLRAWSGLALPEEVTSEAKPERWEGATHVTRD